MSRLGGTPQNFKVQTRQQSVDDKRKKGAQPSAKADTAPSQITPTTSTSVVATTTETSKMALQLNLKNFYGHSIESAKEWLQDLSI
ncbi:hypothetical protein SNE40_020288 [Patella caerulea]|uniref:Uncharacterized protein n=1 Tax=Patella caerulea TaxID=87958 RepID=A0AAN8J4L9_PATCE